MKFAIFPNNYDSSNPRPHYIYIASTFDYASRIAGVLLINGKMDEVRQAASVLPAYLVNAAQGCRGQVQTRSAFIKSRLVKKLN